MKINPVAENIFYKLNPNKSVVYANKQPVSDCFVRSNNVSFSGLSLKDKRDVTINSFIKDLTLKLWTPNFSINEISNSVRKHAKNVTVKSMSKAPEELLFSKYLQGLYSEGYGIDNSTKKFGISDENRTLYVRTETFKEEGGAIFVALNAVHELTHILQSEDSAMNRMGVFNDYLDKNKDDIERVEQQVKITSEMLTKIEESIVRPMITLSPMAENYAVERVNSGQRDMFSWLSKRSKIEDFDAYVKEKLNAGVKNAEQANGVTLDKGLVIDATINHFEREIEAYENENKAFKLWTQEENPFPLARIQIYQNAIQVLMKMKKELA